ncbi:MULTISPECIES: ThiF family adenylyltransferase [unclassified Caballeronia]|uniref:shikimate dehydrogenase family protein n=1 Tax=unclassified Caballeronia TaxID=2646786 RepID=UPI002860286B|nr:MULTISPECIES: ThiF family adenylyltransferase [unclassified Caballeronia]MDR5824887.1 ThiF family adenylyltransferase [Caballeronia sp. LZ043]MDR5882767.1 ThiF family adenylyltransferase [Caballeronia sp. LZ032]
MISGKTTLIAHLGYPTEAFKAPMIYNPWFDQQGIDAVVVPMGVKPDDFVAFLPQLFNLTNIRGALVTMPHKITTLGLMDEVSPTARIAGACNAILKRPDGTLLGDQFDGAGFVRGVERKGCKLDGARVLVLGSGGVGSPIAASLAAAGVAELAIFDMNTASVEGLAARLREHYPQLTVRTDTKDPAGFDVIVNATPLGMKEGDPMPFDIDRIAPATFVGEVVMKSEYTPLLRAAMDKGCKVQVGTDMLFEMIPAYLEFFGYGTASADDLRAVAQIRYA